MKNFKKQEWEIEMRNLIIEINSIQERQYDFENIKAKIKRSVPTNSLNVKRIEEAINDLKNPNYTVMGSNYSGMTEGERANIQRSKADFINIIESIDIKDDIFFLKKAYESIEHNPSNPLSTTIPSFEFGKIVGFNEQETKNIISSLSAKRYVKAGGSNACFWFTQDGINTIDKLKPVLNTIQAPIVDNSINYTNNSVNNSHNTTDSYNTNAEHKESWFNWFKSRSATIYYVLMILIILGIIKCSH